MPSLKIVFFALGLAFMLLPPVASAEQGMPPGRERIDSVTPNDFRLSWGAENALTPEMQKSWQYSSPITRSSARAYYEATDSISAYAGAGMERDPGYLSRARVYGHNHSFPGTDADFGVGELGITVKPMPDSAFTIDLNTKGYAGTRDGVAGNLQLRWEF